jgi:hypothetical protein
MIFNFSPNFTSLSVLKMKYTDSAGIIKIHACKYKIYYMKYEL